MGLLTMTTSLFSFAISILGPCPSSQLPTFAEENDFKVRGLCILEMAELQGPNCWRPFGLLCFAQEAFVYLEKAEFQGENSLRLFRAVVVTCFFDFSLASLFLVGVLVFWLLLLDLGLISASNLSMFLTSRNDGRIAPRPYPCLSTFKSGIFVSSCLLSEALEERTDFECESETSVVLVLLVCLGAALNQGSSCDAS
ncbi:unnamed protein product [Moneuplotes crassus]|uniref:Uncharacterized protein n=1 Tax=Euplotes crassus TaxID=5936 RepID=A0AAD1UNZ3_EUPCR|nr:unnamed protein product [Moneuplotes crassus]